MKDLTIRASSLPTLFDCAARWHAINVEGARMPSSGRAYLGTSIHQATGMFDQSTIEGGAITTEDAVDVVVNLLKNPTEEIAWGNLPVAKAIDLGAKLTVSYCQDVAPAYTFEAVEILCKPLVVRMENDVRITLTGTADRIRVEIGGGDEEGAPVSVARGISDVKSGARIVNSAGEVQIDKHIAQLGTYELIELLVRRETGKDMTLDAQVIALPTGGRLQQAVVESVPRPSKVLLGDGRRHKGLLAAAAAMAHSENFPGNPRSVLCSQNYCPVYNTCWWRGRSRGAL